jgi:hypothetical protein
MHTITELNQLREAALAKLTFQAGRAQIFQSYYDNEAGIIALLDTEERRTFKTFLAEASANWCELVVNAVAERLQVTGFNFGADDDSELAWSIWQANQLDAYAALVQIDALVMSSSFVLVQPDDDNPAGVCISVESPMQATVLYEPGNPRKRIAGYKRYGLDYQYPQAVALAAQQPSNVEVLFTEDEIVTWNPGVSRDTPQIDPNPAGVVGLIEVIPQPRSLLPPRSELHSAMSIQDRINTTIFNKLVATDYGAFRQIWATGIRVAASVLRQPNPDGSTTPVPVTRPFDVGANRLLTNENPDGKFGSFPESTLAGYLSSIEQDMLQLGAITQTPAHYFQLTRMVNLAADAIRAAEAGLIAKCKLRQLYIGEAYEEAMRVALGLVGSPAATYTNAEVIWADPATASEATRADALTKMAALGVPREVIWAKWGASPQEIEQWKAAADAAPPAPAPAAPPPTPAPEPQPVPDSEPGDTGGNDQ